MTILFREARKTDMPIEEDFYIPSISEDMEKTRYALEIAYAGFNNAVEPDMIDCYIYEINSLLKRYEYLSLLAEEERRNAPALCPKASVRALLRHVFG